MKKIKYTCTTFEVSFRPRVEMRMLLNHGVNDMCTVPRVLKSAIAVNKYLFVLEEQMERLATTLFLNLFTGKRISYF